MPKKKSSKQLPGEFNAADFVKSLPDQGREIDIDEVHAKRAPEYFKYITKSNPAYAIAIYLGYFNFHNGKAKMAMQPDQHVLEYLAGCFSYYWEGNCNSLNRAFNMVAKGRGERTPKESYEAKMQSFIEQTVYEEYLHQFQTEREKQKRRMPKGIPSPNEIAMEKTANYFGVSVEWMRQKIRKKKK